MGTALLPIKQALHRVAARLRWQAALLGLVEGGSCAAVLVIGGIGLYRAGTIGRSGLSYVGLAAIGVLVADVLFRALRPIEPLSVAGRIDRSHGLSDRLSSALQFSGAAETDALRRLALADAARLAPQIEPARAAPFHRPSHLGVLFFLICLVPVAAFLRLPRRGGPAQPLAPLAAGDNKTLRLYVEPEWIAPEREEIARMQKEAVQAGDEELKDAAEEMGRLLDQIERGELTRKEAFDRLAELEQRLMQGKEGALEELREKLRKAGAELGTDKLAKELGKALQKEDLEQAKKELERLARRAEGQARSAKEQERQRQEKTELAQSLKRAAEPERSADQWQDKSQAEQRTRQEQELREQERQLKKKMEQNPADEDSARRLKKVQRELQRLEREKQERAEAQRELERLQRDLQQAAEEMQRQLDKMTPEQRQAMEQLAKDMSRMQDEISKLQKNQKGQGRGQAMVMLGSLKQVLRRVARSGNGPGQNGQGQNGQDGQGQGRLVQGQNGQGQDGQNGHGAQNGQGQGGQNGQDGQNGKNKGAMKDFLERASGKGQGGDSDVLVEGDGKGKGDQNTMLLGQGGDNPVLLPGLGQQGQQGPGKNGGGNDPGKDPGGKNGDGIGNQHDPNLLGDATHLDSRRRQTRLQGQQGAGPSRSETILGSAERGFSSQSYKKVYGDYTAVSEDALSKERVPPGYRFYVKRYFQLIKPRE